MKERLSAVALLVALAVGAWVRWTSPERLADLRPRPDAIEYEEAARNLVQGRGYTLRIGRETYPPRYPPGFSLLIAPLIAAGVDEPGSGIWVVLAAALAAIAATWRLGGVAGGAPAAAIAAWMAALSPLSVRWSRAVMSDVPAMAAAGWLGVWLVVRLGQQQRAAPWLVFGIVCGLATSIRGGLLALVVPGLALAASGRCALRLRLRRTAALLAGVAIGQLPTLACNAWLLGSPFRSGYGYWAPTAFFSLEHLWQQPLGGESGNLPFYLGVLAGFGRLYPWPIAALAAAGLVRLLRATGPRRDLGIVVATVVVSTLAMQLPFFWQWDRYLLPTLPFLLAAAGAPFAPEARLPLRAVSTALALLALAIVLRSHDPFAPPDRDILDARTLRSLDAVVEPNAVIARTSPFLFERLLRRESDRVWIPIGQDLHRATARELGRAPIAIGPPGSDAWLRDPLEPPIDRGQLVRRAREVMAEGRPLYVSTQLAFQDPAVALTVQILAGRFALEPVALKAGSAVYRLRMPAAVR